MDVTKIIIKKLWQVTWQNDSQRVDDFYTLRNEVRGGILDSLCLSVCPSVRLSVR